MKYALLATAVLTLFVTPAAAQTAADSAAIRATAKDYIEGWYEGNVDRMAQALHPELAKRIVGWDDAADRPRLSNMTKETLVGATGRGGGTQTPEAQRRTDVTILDIFGGIAAVRVDADAWVDHMQIAKWGDRWVIVNVLWAMRD